MNRIKLVVPLARDKAKIANRAALLSDGMAAQAGIPLVSLGEGALGCGDSAGSRQLRALYAAMSGASAPV